MGLYEYWCERCKETYKMWKHVKPEPGPMCPRCGAVGAPQLGMVLRFKGNQEHWQTPTAAIEATPGELADEDS